MISKIKYIFLYCIFLSFISSITFHYFSESNIINTNKKRAKKYLKNITNIPLLKNDTQNIIEYTDGVEKFKKSKKKYKFFDLLKD